MEDERPWTPAVCSRFFFQCELHATWHIISSIFINILDPPDITRCDQLHIIHLCKDAVYKVFCQYLYRFTRYHHDDEDIIIKTRPSTFFDGCPYSYGWSLLFRLTIIFIHLSWPQTPASVMFLLFLVAAPVRGCLSWGGVGWEVGCGDNVLALAHLLDARSVEVSFNFNINFIPW